MTLRLAIRSSTKRTGKHRAPRRSAQTARKAHADLTQYMKALDAPLVRFDSVLRVRHWSDMVRIGHPEYVGLNTGERMTINQSINQSV